MYLFCLTSLWILFAFVTSASYVLSPDDIYQGNTFFEKFNFFTAADPNWGFVQYLDQNAATNSRLTSVNQAQQAYIGVDYENVYDPNGTRGRPSIRLESKKQYQYGLFVFDLAHMPTETCGKWSAFWTTNQQDWPRWGEIDIIENIHENNNTLEALHTSPGCSVAGNQITTQMTGKQTTYNCDGAATSSQYGSQGAGQGCVAENMNPNNYGKAFNEVGGGVYVMEWNNQAINIWNFKRESIPQDLVSEKPNPESWPQPVFTTKQGSCNVDDHFKDHRIIIDSSFCGQWAGQDAFWQQTSCYKSDPAKYSTCNSYVATNPAVYKDSYWLVNSLKVYQNQASGSPNAPAPARTGQISPVSGTTTLQDSRSDAPSPSPQPNSSISEIDSDEPATDTASTAPVETTYASVTPSSYVNATASTYRPTATGSTYSMVSSAFVTQTLAPIAGSPSSNGAIIQPTPKFETAGSSKVVRVGGSSVIALIAALALGMAF